MAGLEPKPSTAMSKFHFPASFHLGKCRDVDGDRLCINPAAVFRNRICKATTTSQISHKPIFTVISLVYLYHSWLQFPSSVHLGVLPCVGISVLSAGLCWSYQKSLENTPPPQTKKPQIKEFLCKETNCPIKPFFLWQQSWAFRQWCATFFNVLENPILRGKNF